MKYSSIIFVFFALVITFFLFPKNDTNNKVPELSKKNFPKYNLVFTDTVEFQTDGDVIWILDKNDSFYLGMNSSKNKIYLYDHQGNLLTTINKEGDGPQEYRKIKKIALTPNGNVIIVNINKALIFDRTGVFLTECTTLHRDFLPVGLPRSIAPNDSMIVFSSAHTLNIQQDVSYFRNKENFTSTCLNVFTCEFENFAPYEKESIYAEKFLPLMNNKLYAFDYKNNNIIATYPFDKNIFVYHYGTNKEKYKQINTYPEHFGLIEGAKGGDDGIDRQIYLVQKNSSYRGIEVSTDNKVLLSYTKGNPEEQIYKSLAKSNNSDYKPDSYLEVYDLLSGKKIIGDIIDTSENTRLVDFIDMENIIFYTNKLNNNELENKLHIIYARLEKVTSKI